MIVDEGSVRVLTWDHGSQLDFDDLATYVEELSAGQVLVHKVDTRSSQYVLVLARRPLEPAEAEAEWDMWRFGY